MEGVTQENCTGLALRQQGGKLLGPGTRVLPYFPRTVNHSQWCAFMQKSVSVCFPFFFFEIFHYKMRPCKALSFTRMVYDKA